MYKLDKTHAVKRLSEETKAALTVESGSVVELDTWSCFGNQTLPEMRGTLQIDQSLAGNPSTGPVFVEGAEPGDVLKVEILEITPTTDPVMAMDDTMGVFAKEIPEHILTYFKMQDNTIEFDEHCTVPVRCMLGVIGTAPAAPAESDMLAPGSQGGNMDCRRIVAGSTVYLPVNVEGGLLVLGDVHAAMGDGEVCGCGAEVEATVKIKVSVLKDAAYPCPMILSDGYAMTVYSHVSLDEAADEATRRMHRFIQKELGMPYAEAGMLLSLVSDVRICQIVDPVKTCRLEVPMEVFEAYGYQFK